MNLSKLKLADRIVVLSAIVYFVATWLTWFTAEISGTIAPEVTVNGWETDGAFFWVWVPLALGIFMSGLVVVRRFSPQTKLPDVAMGWGQVEFFLGVLAAGLVLLKFLLGEDAPTLPGYDIDVSRSIGLFLAVLAAAGLAAGGYLAWQDDKKGVGGGKGTPPTPF